MGNKSRVACSLLTVAVFLLGVAFVVAGLVYQFAVFPGKLNSTVYDSKVIGNNADGTPNQFTASFSNPSYPTYTQYWIFDYKNNLAVENRGGFPDVDQKGPYTYRTIIENRILNYDENDTVVEYIPIQTYVFDKNMSCADCDPTKDLVLVPDIVYHMVFDGLETALKGFDGNENETFLENLIPHVGALPVLFKSGPFVQVTVDQFLFRGYVSPLNDAVTQMLTYMQQFYFLIQNLIPDDVLQLIVGALQDAQAQSANPVNYISTNGSASLIYRVDTGRENGDRAGYLLDIINEDNPSFSSNGSFLSEEWWPFDENNINSCSRTHALQARQLDGTSGDFFKNFISTRDELPIYVNEICRTGRLTYVNDITVHNISGYRFSIPNEMFDPSFSENCGFCRKLPRDIYDIPVGSECLPRGLLDLSGCQKQGDVSLPIVASQPHFYGADVRALNFVPRFKPTEDDSSTIDIEPITGTVLQANKRIQYNLFVGHQPAAFSINSYSSLRSGAYPLFFVNQSTVIDDSSRDQLQDALAPINTVRIVCWVAVGIGAALIVASIFSTIIVCSKRKAE